MQLHLKVIEILDRIDLKICISAPSTRPLKNTYTSTSIEGVKIANIDSCFHQENIEEGLKYHAMNLKQALRILSQLKEVKAAFHTGRDKHGVYEVVCDILELLKEQCRHDFNINTEEY